MKILLEYLEGKKTYLAGAVIFLLLFGTWQGWWKIPDEVYSGLLALGLMFLRSGSKRDIAKLQTPDSNIVTTSVDTSTTDH